MNSEHPSEFELRFGREVPKQVRRYLRGVGERLLLSVDNVLDELRQNPLPRQGSNFIRHLSGNRYRARVAVEFRIVYSIDDHVVNIIWFGHRKDAYR